MRGIREHTLQGQAKPPPTSSEPSAPQAFCVWAWEADLELQPYPALRLLPCSLGFRIQQGQVSRVPGCMGFGVSSKHWKLLWAEQGLTWPSQGLTHGMQTLDKIAISQGLKHGRPQTCHNPHAGHHISRIGELYPNAGQWGAHGAHAEWKHIHGAACRRGKCALGEGIQTWPLPTTPLSLGSCPDYPACSLETSHPQLAGIWPGTSSFPAVHGRRQLVGALCPAERG